MPLMEVVLEGTYENQQIVNRWNYLASGTPAAVSLSFGLADALGAIYNPDAIPPAYPPDRMLRIIMEHLSSQFVLTFLSVRDVYSDTDFYQTPFVQPFAGLVTTESMSPAMAYGFSTNRTRLDVRRATKRFVGVPETGVASGGALTAGALSNMQAIAAAMSDVLEYDDEGNTLVYQPVVAGKEKYEVPGSSPVRYAYRYYEVEAEQLAKLAEGVLWTPYTTVRTQTSRQYGRGR